jgi:hypothetical protein
MVYVSRNPSDDSYHSRLKEANGALVLVFNMDALSSLARILSIVDVAVFPLLIVPESTDEIQGVVDVCEAELDIESLCESVRKS